MSDDSGETASHSVAGTKTLEDSIRAALHGVPTDAALSEKFVDASDRLRVRRRAAIAAVLDAIFDHGFEQHNGAEAVIDHPADVPEDVLSLVNVARRDFLHDRDLLDAGRPAELVLRPVGREAVDDTRGIKPSRKLMILGLAMIEIWSESDRLGFENRTEVLTFVAKTLGMAPGAIKTQRSNFAANQKCSSAEHALYSDTVNVVRTMAGGSVHSAFALLLPAFRALCEDAYPRVASAAPSS